MIKRFVLSRIDSYRAKVSPHCTFCQTRPTESFSYQVREKVNENLLAGLVMLSLGVASETVFKFFSTGSRDKFGWRKGGI